MICEINRINYLINHKLQSDVQSILLIISYNRVYNTGDYG